MPNNQCQGCQAGWKVETLDIGFDDLENIEVHVVEGGYDGEKIICTKHDYFTPTSNE